MSLGFVREHHQFCGDLIDVLCVFGIKSILIPAKPFFSIVNDLRQFGYITLVILLQLHK